LVGLILAQQSVLREVEILVVAVCILPVVGSKRRRSADDEAVAIGQRYHRGIPADIVHFDVARVPEGLCGVSAHSANLVRGRYTKWIRALVATRDEQPSVAEEGLASAEGVVLGVVLLGSGGARDRIPILVSPLLVVEMVFVIVAEDQHLAVGHHCRMDPVDVS